MSNIQDYIDKHDGLPIKESDQDKALREVLRESGHEEHLVYKLGVFFNSYLLNMANLEPAEAWIEKQEQENEFWGSVQQTGLGRGELAHIFTEAKKRWKAMLK